MRMAELDMEKQETLAEAQTSYLEAFAEYSTFLDTHDINHRTMEEIHEASRLESVCMWAKYRFELAQHSRYRI